MPDAILETMAERFRMLADPTRLAILHALMAGERSVGEVVAQTNRGQANVSKHLRMLADSRLIARRKQGLQVFYRISNPLVEQLCELVCGSIVRDAQDQMDRATAVLNSTTNRP